MAVDASSTSKVLGALAANLSELGGTITSAQMIDPYVPVDGTMNVTGAFTASGTVTAGGSTTITASAQDFPGAGSGGFSLTGPGGYGFSAWASTTAVNKLLAMSNGSGVGGELRSYQADGASNIAWKFSAQNDLTTAGAKIVSFGDNAGSSYAEGACLFAVPSANPTAHAGVQFNTAHIGGGSTALSLNTCRIGLGAGTTSSGTAVTASGHDLAGRIGVTVNSTGTVSQPVLLISWATAYNTPPFVQLTPGNATAATQSLATSPFIVSTTSGFSVQANTTGMPAGTYVWFYNVIQ